MVQRLTRGARLARRNDLAATCFETALALLAAVHAGERANRIDDNVSPTIRGGVGDVACGVACVLVV